MADRLFKIRNSLNIRGIFRQLPLFEPPIDPALLARAAAAKLTPTDAPKPRALALFERYGAPSLLLSWVPLLGDAIVALAGASRVPITAFSLWTLIGKAARYAAVAWIALRV